MHSRLTQIKSEFDIDVEYFYVQMVVNWLGHCFRHSSHLISKLLSLPVDGRLSELRSRGVETPLSFFALGSWLNLVEVGLHVDIAISGRPNDKRLFWPCFSLGSGVVRVDP